MSFKDVTKTRLLEDMIRPVHPRGWKVLIVDKHTVRIISAASRMYDILEEGVTLVEKIDIPRQPLRDLEAIYFLSPTEDSVDKLLEDFQSEKTALYASAHVFFCSSVSKGILEKLKKNRTLISRAKTVKELNLDFLAYENQVFHLDWRESFYSLYSPESTDSQQVQQMIAEKLATVCATLREYPHIRYSNNTSSKLSNAVAKMVQDKIDNLMRSSPDYANNAKVSTNERAILLVVDRTQDVMAPILHEFTYQAMIYDLLPVDSDHYKYQATLTKGESKTKEVILAETDPLWPTLRHMHIADTINWILDAFQQFIKENKADKYYSGKEINTLKEMTEAMKSMPQYQEMLSKYSLHINMANQCMEVFNKKNLVKVASLEQDMSTGEEADGKPVKNILGSLPPLLQLEGMDQDDKLRLLMIYIISQEGIKAPDRKRLMDIANISSQDQACISNLRFLGVTLSKGTQAKKKQKLKEKKKKKQPDDAPPYELSRYVPTLKKIGEDLISNTLSTTEFPFVKDPGTALDSTPQTGKGESLRKGSQPRWAEKGGRKSTKNEKPMGSRIIMFVIGGMTFSETRIAYELSQKFNREVVIGSTHPIIPSQFIQDLRDLKKMDQVDDFQLSL